MFCPAFFLDLDDQLGDLLALGTGVELAEGRQRSKLEVVLRDKVVGANVFAAQNLPGTLAGRS